MTAAALACLLARDPAVAAALRAPPAKIAITRGSAVARAFPGEASCVARDARLPNGTEVVIGIAPGSPAALQRRSDAAKRLGFWSDDGRPVTTVGVPAVTSYVNGVSALAGTRLLRIAVYPGGRDRDQIVEAEGILVSDEQRAESLARRFAPRVAALR